MNNTGGAKLKTHANPFNKTTAVKKVIKKGKQTDTKKFSMSSLANALDITIPKKVVKKREKEVPFIYTTSDTRITRPAYMDITFKSPYKREFEELFTRVDNGLVGFADKSNNEYNQYANNLVEAYDAHYFTMRDQLIQHLMKNKKKSDEMQF
jgi:hypothetical protein